MDCRVTPGNDGVEMGEGVACRLVPQGGFEPSTYRLRSDCSAVELLRHDPGALISAALCLGKARRQGNGSICQRTPLTDSARASATTARVGRLLRPPPRWRGRDREGARKKIERARAPPPQPSPASGGGSAPRLSLDRKAG